MPQVNEALFIKACVLLAEKIAVEEDQSWRSTLRDRFAAMMSALGDRMPVAAEIEERSATLTEAYLRVHGRTHETVLGL